MKVRISEVWNDEGRSVELATITTTRSEARQAVYDWVQTHRPDLHLATTMYDHGFHAAEISESNIQNQGVQS